MSYGRGVRMTVARNAAWWGVGMMCAAAGMYATKKRLLARSFENKVVVITGGSRGLGLAMAEEFGRRGARLVLAARHREELERAAQQLVRTGAIRDKHVLTVAADLGREEDAANLIRQATDHFGRVDVLVNNAGIITVGPVENQTVDDFHTVMDANFFSHMHCTMAVLPQMIERREGRIANITSIGGKVAAPHMLPYTASKFAAVGFSEGLAVEMRSKGVRVTTVVPGLMRTGSPPNALFTGDAAREYRWFSLSDNLPGISISARRAARQIVDAIESGAAEVAITPQAYFASRFGNVAPRLTRTVMQVMNLFLPDAQPGNSAQHRGEDVNGLEPLPARTLGRAAAKRYNQTRHAG
jgi:NAD(P)-dependent dehydrogenase (short-subunit alcohol dehydrogenase family)